MDRNRRHVRHLITPRLYVAMNGSSAGGILYDVSPGGLSLDVVGPKPSGDRVLLDFDMPETGEHFEGSGRIIWQKDPGNRVGIQFIDLPQSSHLKIKSWISARSISAGSSQNMLVRDRADTTFMGSPEALVERAAAPVAVRVSPAVLEPTSNKPASISTPAGATTLLSQPLASPPQERSNAAPPKTGDRDVQELRTLFSQHVLAEPEVKIDERRENNPPDWKQARQWLLVAGVILFAVMFLATAIKIFSSPEFNAGVTYQAVKSKLASGIAKLMESPASQQAAKSRVSSVNAQPVIEPKAPAAHDSRAATAPAGNSADAINPGAAKAPAPDDRFEVTDALHGRRYLPRTSTNLIVQFQRPGGFKQVDVSASASTTSGKATAPGQASATPPSSTTNLLAPASNLQLGRVLRESSGERPVMEAMPDYPQIALQQNVQGRVVLTAVIATDGTLKDVRILSAPSLLDSTVLGAVRTWRYQPHFRDGQPVEVVTEIVVDFFITTK
jgi:TonB family protein